MKNVKFHLFLLVLTMACGCQKLSSGKSLTNKVHQDTSHNTPQLTRLTNTYPHTGSGIHYVRNGFSNADGTLLYAEVGGEVQILNMATGEIVESGSPGGSSMSFDPVNPDIYYYPEYQGNRLYRRNIKTHITDIFYTFNVPLKSLGGSVDWISADGNYMVLNLNDEIRIFNVINKTLYDGSFSANFGSGWIGISPNGEWIIEARDTGFYAFKINHNQKSLTSQGHLIWSLCGDHGDLVSGSDGKTYLVAFECYDDPSVYRVDVSIAQSLTNLEKQRSDNKKLLQLTWNDSGHFSGISKGEKKDWVVYSVNDHVNLSLSPDLFYPHRNEIGMVNVMTGEVKHLTYHNSIYAGYCTLPRAMATWSGNRIVYVSNYGEIAVNNDCGFSDYYAIEF